MFVVGCVLAGFTGLLFARHDLPDWVAYIAALLICGAATQIAERR